jgi:hypothetical protein
MVEDVVQVTQDLDGRLQAALDAGLVYDTSDDEPNIVRQEMVDEVEQVPDNVPTTDCRCWDGMHADPDCMECDGSGLLFREGPWRCRLYHPAACTSLWPKTAPPRALAHSP